MGQRIYLDDCAYDREVVRALQQAGHEVVTPAQAGITGRSDDVHFRHAAERDLILLTRNADDFVELHEHDPKHAGIFVVYQDNNPDRDMSHTDIVRAIANLVSAGVTFPGTVQVLNAWRY